MGTSCFSVLVEGVYGIKWPLERLIFKTKFLKFVKTHTFKNMYNTLAAFDGSQWHAADNLWTKPGEDRLTMVFFINKLKVKSTPRTRLDMMEQAVI